LLSRFNNSLHALAKGIFPDIDWQAWKFLKSPDGWRPQTGLSTATSADLSHSAKELALSLSNSLGIQDMSDWYRVSRADLDTIKATNTLRKFASTIAMSPDNSTMPTPLISLELLLTAAYPEHNWDSSRFHPDSSRFRPGVLQTRQLESSLPNKKSAQFYLKQASKTIFPHESTPNSL